MGLALMPSLTPIHTCVLLIYTGAWLCGHGALCALADLWTALHGVAIVFGLMRVWWAVPVLSYPWQ